LKPYKIERKIHSNHGRKLYRDILNQSLISNCATRVVSILLRLFVCFLARMKNAICWCQ